MLQSGEYEDVIEGNSSWNTGDWNADADFTTDDLVLAFQDGGYEQGLQASVSAVPEPSMTLLVALAATFESVANSSEENLNVGLTPED